MRLMYFLFVCSLSMLVLVAVGYYVPESREAAATAHPQYPTMLKSSGGIVNQPIGYHYFWMLAILGVMTSCILIGVRRRAKTGEAGKWLAVVMVGYAAVFSALVHSYYQYASGDATFFGGFPAPTAWMIYGIWFFPVIILFLYVRNFDRWILSPEDLARFKQLVARNQQEGGEI